MRYVILFETIMLLCFTSAWMVSVYRSYTARSNRGKSLYFLFVILAGYISGTAFQLMAHADAMLPLFIIFLSMALVLTDIALYFRNAVIEKRAGSIFQF